MGVQEPLYSRKCSLRAYCKTSDKLAKGTFVSVMIEPGSIVSCVVPFSPDAEALKRGRS